MECICHGAAAAVARPSVRPYYTLYTTERFFLMLWLLLPGGALVARLLVHVVGVVRSTSTWLYSTLLTLLCSPPTTTWFVMTVIIIFPQWALTRCCCCCCCCPPNDSSPLPTTTTVSLYYIVVRNVGLLTVSTHRESKTSSRGSDVVVAAHGSDSKISVIEKGLQALRETISPS